jgi:hypothetical protein
MLTPLADIRTVCTVMHCHEMVEADAIRAADDHMLSPQAGFCGRNNTPTIAKVV